MSQTANHRGTLTVIAWSTAIIAVIAVVAVAKLASDIVAPTVLAALFAITLTPVMRVLERWGIPSSVAAATIILLGVGAVLLAAYTLAPSAEDWRSRAPAIIRSVERKARSIERDISDSVEQTTGAPAEQLSEGKSPTDTVLESGENLLADVIMSAPQKLLWLVYTSFLCFFLLAERAKFRRAVIALPARYSMRLQIGRALRDMRQSVSRYLLTISVINAVLGMAATAAFWATGLPNAPLWGTLVALLNFMPYVGPLIANAIVLAVGLGVFPAPGDAFVPVAALVFLNTMEGQFVTPTVVGKRWRISPLAVFVALTFGGWLWGAIGALVAAPVLIVALALFDRIAPRRRGPQRREIRPGRIGGPADGVASRAPAG